MERDGINLLIRGGRVVDPATGTDRVADIKIADGQVAAVGPSLEAGGARIVDASGFHVFPGLVDLHTHFREPGFEAKETIATGARAALRGGFVASVSMPNTEPACDQQSIADNIIRKAREVPYHIFPAGTISKGRQGKELSEMADLRRAGVVAVTDDGSWVADALLMRRALEYASMLGLIVISHCEDSRLAAKGVMHEGLISTTLGLPGIPAVSEEIAVARDIELTRATGARLHVCHVSSRRSVELIRRAKAEGLSVTADITPHHLALTHEEIEGYNTNLKVNPPLRTAEDRKALRDGLRDGTIDCVATDHAPHTQEEKMREFDHAPFGTIGLETALAVILTELHHGEGWPLADVLRCMAVRPAEILGLQEGFGAIRPGGVAHLTLVDVAREWTVSASDFESKSRNSCFMRKTLKGKVLATLCCGRWWEFEPAAERPKAREKVKS